MMKLIWIKQHLSNIWSSIHAKIKQHWGWVEGSSHCKLFLMFFHFINIEIARKLKCTNGLQSVNSLKSGLLLRYFLFSFLLEHLFQGTLDRSKIKLDTHSRKHIQENTLGNTFDFLILPPKYQRKGLRKSY